MDHETKYLNDRSLEVWNAVEKRYRTEKTRQICWDSLVFLCEYAKKDMLDITPGDVKKFYEVQKQSEEKDEGTSSVNSEMRLASINTIYEWYWKNVDNNYENPCTAVESEFRAPELIPTEYPSKEELSDMKARLDADRQYHFISMITEYTGAKGKDVLLLKHAAFRETGEGFIVTLGAGSRKKPVLLPQSENDFLRKFLKDREYLPHLLDNMWGKPLTQRTMERTFEVLSEQTQFSLSTYRTAVIADHIAECMNSKEYTENLFIDRKKMKKYTELAKYYM
ncbi:MAG: hypothetical protein ACK5ML_00830 [Lachnospiraceae bacterium]